MADRRWRAVRPLAILAYANRMYSLAQNLFLVILCCEAVLAVILCLSILVPEKRVWPPPNGKSWQMYAVWTPTIVAFLATIWLGVLDWNTFVLDHWGRFVASGFLLSGGYAIYFLARQSLGWKMMLGIEGKHVATGLYRYTRNPMYIGDIALCLGFALLCNSLLVYVVAVIGSVLFLFTPCAEEPWLRDRYGTAYDDYVVKVPRFVPSFRQRMNP